MRVDHHKPHAVEQLGGGPIVIVLLVGASRGRHFIRDEVRGAAVEQQKGARGRLGVVALAAVGAAQDAAHDGAHVVVGADVVDRVVEVGALAEGLLVGFVCLVVVGRGARHRGCDFERAGSARRRRPPLERVAASARLFETRPRLAARALPRLAQA